MRKYDARWVGSPVDVEPKDPNAIIDYAWDWTAWLADRGNDTISNSTWTVPAGLTEVSNNESNGVAAVFLSGGVDGYKYVVTNRIVTAGGRTEERSFRIPCEEK